MPTEEDYIYARIVVPDKANANTIIMELKAWADEHNLDLKLDRMPILVRARPKVERSRAKSRHIISRTNTIPRISKHTRAVQILAVIDTVGYQKDRTCKGIMKKINLSKQRTAVILTWMVEAGYLKVENTMRVPKRGSTPNLYYLTNYGRLLLEDAHES